MSVVRRINGVQVRRRRDNCDAFGRARPDRTRLSERSRSGSVRMPFARRPTYPAPASKMWDGPRRDATARPPAAAVTSSQQLTAACQRREWRRIRFATSRLRPPLENMPVSVVQLLRHLVPSEVRTETVSGAVAIFCHSLSVFLSFSLSLSLSLSLHYG